MVVFGVDVLNGGYPATSVSEISFFDDVGTGTKHVSISAIDIFSSLVKHFILHMNNMIKSTALLLT